jgi:hypothetical protein
METRRGPTTVRHTDAKPTPKQVYALAHALCRRTGETFPSTRGAASALIERLRAESEEDADM